MSSEKKGFSLKIVGRILMLVVAGLMLFYGIRYWVNFSKFAEEFEGFSFENALDSVNAVAGLLKAIAFILFAISAIFSAIKGKAKFKYFIFSIIIIAICVLNISAASKQPSFNIIDYIGPTIVVPILYVAGSLFLFF